MEFQQPPLHFLIEGSPTPIFQRIATAYKLAFEKHGHQVTFFEIQRVTELESDLAAFQQVIRSSQATHLVVFEDSFLSNQYLEECDRFVFEQFERSLIFIHLDNIWTRRFTSASGESNSYFSAWRRVQSRSTHFCLEYKNFLDLRELDFQRVYSIFHGSEFSLSNPSDHYDYDVSFVGHVLPGLHQISEQIHHLPFYHLISADFWSRLISFDQAIDPSAVTFASQQQEAIRSPEFIRRKSDYYYVINSLVSMYFRGEVLSRIHPQFKVDIIGGDLAYLHGVSLDRRLENPNISYHPPTHDYAVTQQIYANSKINLNITGLQFDQAVVNRVTDVAAAGGFVLTDWKPDLRKITSVSEQISYKTLDELNQKIAYYLTHTEERLEIAAQLHQDVVKNCHYDRIITSILSKISPMPETPEAPVCIDLGCGPYKPEGFIGVDISDRPDVDITADLNQRFPFPDNSVDVVRAHDVVEHLADRIHTMNEIWRICKPNALVDIRVPSTDGRGAFQDPTHISFWNINSFKYYSIEFPEYLDLCRIYGFRGAFHITTLEHEPESNDGVIHVRATLRAIKSEHLQPDELMTKLKLRPLNFIVFPDWQHLDESYQSLTDVMRTIAQHPDRQQITLLVSQGNFQSSAEASLEEVLYNLVLNLFLSEGIDVASEGVEISIVEGLNPAEFAALQQQQLYRIPLSQQSNDTLANYGAKLSTCELETLNQKRLS